MKISAKKLILFSSLIFLFAVAILCYYGVPLEGKPEYITLLHTNDVHGRLQPFQYKENQEFVGGIARRASLIKHIESTNKCVLTMDAGDFAQGSLFFNVFNGVPDAELMSAAGYDIGTLGNHEFDKGLTFLKDILKEFKYPIVSSNIRFPKDKELQSLVLPYIIKNCHGMKVAIIGLVPENLKSLSSAGDVEIFDNIETTKLIVEKVNSKADMIVVLSHSGIEDDIELAKKVPEVDVIIGGHTHTLLKQPKMYNHNNDKTLIVQAGELGAYLGRLDINIKNKEIQNYYYELIPVNEDIEPDKAIKNRVAVLAQQIDTFTQQKIGQLAVPIGVEGEQIRSKLLPSGSLVTESIKSEFPDVDIVLQNSGGIRPYKHLGPGAVTEADVIRLFPFENKVVILDLKGDDLQSVLEMSSAKLPDESGGFLQSLGLEYTVDVSKEPGNRVSGVVINGNPINYDKYYKLAINDYIFRGGNGFYQFKNAVNIQKPDKMVRDVIIKYITENSPVTVEVRDRINIVQ